MTKEQMQTEALARARQGISGANYPAIFAGFVEKGIPESDIKPRENVLTYDAWRAIGRQVCKGEHGVKVNTWIAVRKQVQDEETGEVIDKGYRRPKLATVFHISQTKAL